jgi:hypothetical protein
MQSIVFRNRTEAAKELAERLYWLKVENMKINLLQRQDES